MKQQKERKNKEMEVEENFIRVSQNQPIYKPQIQQNQFFKFQQTNNIEITQLEIRQKMPIENMSEEDKVNKPNTSSEERQISQSPVPKKQIEEWSNMKVDTSIALLKNQEKIILDSFKIVNQAISDQKICFSKVNTKQLFKEYLTKNNIDTKLDTKDIPTGIYLIMIIEAQYINQSKIIAKQAKHQPEYETNIQAFTEAIATYALGILPYQVEQDKIKLSASRQHITTKLIDIIQSEEEITQAELYQIRTQNQQNTNLNIIIHLSTRFLQDKNQLIEMTK
ncbi:hypothetical protein ABPG72_002900 [Tetrahymena utriculariae]